MPFIPHTPQQQQEMLDTIGLTMEGLFADIPAELERRFDLSGIAEKAAREHTSGAD